MSFGELQRIDSSAEWQALLARSPHATRFLDYDFLSIFDTSFSLYGLYRKGVCTVGLPVIGNGAISLPWCYYQGPIFYDEITKGAVAKQIQKEVELSEYFTTALAAEVDTFQFVLHPDFQDVRGYDWVHYHDETRQRCRLKTAYTAVVDLDGKTKEDLRSGARQSRRHEERYAMTRDHLVMGEMDNIDLMFEFYCQTFARQGTEVKPLEAKLFHRYCSYFLTNGSGRILCIKNGDDAVVAAALVFEDYDKTWHVPIVALGDTRYGGTLLYFHILDTALAANAKAVDFNGANSPQRAYFKHSLGARPQLFFQVNFDASGTKK